MIILGGSPLGLVGVTTDSRKTTSNKIQYSTFNAGKSRNVNVYQYNSGDGGGQPSLFTGRRKIRPWPNIKMINGEGGSVPDPLGLGDFEKEALYKTQGRKGDSYSRKDLHNNDVYDTSITHLIDKLANTKASLRPADFAYLKDLGVYPNNRLMIARRFLGPIDDNIMVNSGGDVGSLATIVSWMPETEDLFSINFGEVWGEADASFSGIIDGIGNDFKMKGLGEIMGGAGGAIPLPGFTEILQRQLMAKMGIISEGSANTIPSGNPNLIKEAKVRKTIGYDEPGSGLTGKLSFKVTAEYEMKFISGLDPTIVWMDIISNILRFGTSTSINWGLNKSFAAKMKKWINNPGALLNELGTQIKVAVGDASKLILQEANNLKDAFAKEQAASGETKVEDDGDDDPEATMQEFIDKAKKAYDGIIGKVIRGLKSVLNGVVAKYKVKAIGVFNALTGSPSTPWHLTIGNPLRPIFCCGDMLTQDVTLTMGSQLAFNDLPSSIKVEFVLTNARNLGLQEIMSKFNSGYLRTVDVQKSFYETNTYQVGDKTFYESPGFYEYENPLGDKVTTTISADGTPVVAASSELVASESSETVVVEEEKPAKDPSGKREKGNDWYGWNADKSKPYEGYENDLGKEAKKKWESINKKTEKGQTNTAKANAAKKESTKANKNKSKPKDSKKSVVLDT